ncbi:hypothetical protein Q5P01_025434 [Channa striata]|uniref:Uncharacterized protein n=1 Tax=Channa striata TaxID=64152 RepID=A0AA88LP41_CHASR|nr:hypothetical protein Q5P01_025434 [Channa striata]
MATHGHPSGRNYQHPDRTENNPLHEEIVKLNDLLNRERHWRIQLFQELEHTKEHMAHQKNLTEVYINREKELKRHLERLEKTMGAESLCTSKTALDDSKNRKKNLQKDYEELQVAHRISQQKFTAELQLQKDINKALTKEVDKLRAAHEEVSVQYNAAVLSAKQQADTLREQFATEIKTFIHRVAEDNVLIQSLGAEINTLHQKIVDDIKVLQQNAAQMEILFQKDLKQLKTQLNVQMSLNLRHKSSQEKLTAELQLEKDKNKGLKEELDKIRAAYDDVSVQYNAAVWTAKQQTDTLYQEFARERKSFNDQVANDERLIQNLRAEMDKLCQKMTDEIRVLQQNGADKEMLFQKELQELKTQLGVQTSLNLELKAELEAERNIARSQNKLNELCTKEKSVPNVHFHHEPAEKTGVSVESLAVEAEDDFPETTTAVCKEEQENQFEDRSEESDDDKDKNDQGRQESSFSNAIPDPKPAEVGSDDLPPRKTKKKSVWKRVNHFLGLGKQQK